ncbi:MAG: arylsulfatase [Verrucomicrobiota bacterium]
MVKQLFPLVLLGLLAGLDPAHSKLPHVVLIVADDFGVGSVNAYGAPKELVRTPHLDRLAEKGMRFTNANTPGAICSPTRYALLTGRYAWRGPLPFGVVNLMEPLVVETDRPTLPKYMQKLGYQTAQIGKWHLGYGDAKRTDFTQPLAPGANEVGFDYHFGLPNNLDDAVGVWIENDGVYGLRSTKLSPYSKSFYGRPYLGLDAPQRVREEASQELISRAIDWIQRSARGQPEKPLFLYFATAAVHHPIEPSERMRGASGCGAYGDFIQDLDASVGRIVEALEYEGLMDDTLLVFTADNGADVPRNDKTRPENQAVQAGLAPNGVHRGDKHTIYEGGVRVPLLVRWDGQVAAGSVSDRMVNIVDLFATLVECVSGRTPLADHAPDSISFASTLAGQDQEPRPAMVSSNAAGLHALRLGPWKYIDDEFPEGTPEALQKSNRSQAERALFHLENDPSEGDNVIAEHPEIAERMEAMLQELREEPTRRP